MISALREPNAGKYALRIPNKTHKPPDRTSFDPPHICARGTLRKESYHASSGGGNRLAKVLCLRSKALLVETVERS